MTEQQAELLRDKYGIAQPLAPLTFEEEDRGEFEAMLWEIENEDDEDATHYRAH